MGKMLYKIGRVDHSKYFLKIEKEKLWGNNEILTEQFHVPFLDFLNSFRGEKIYDLFLEFIIKNYNLQEIKSKEKYLSSFTFLMLHSINDRSNKRKDLRHYVSISDITFNNDILRIPEYDLTKQKERRNFILFLHSNYEECNINHFISHQGILQSTTKEYIKEKEKEILNFIVDDCEIILEEMVNQFDGIILNENCIQRILENQIGKQSLKIKKQEIKKSYLPIINKVLKKNPELNKPNIIKLSGEPLVNYLLSYRSYIHSKSEWNVFYLVKENVSRPEGELYESYHFTLQLNDKIESINDKYFFLLDSCDPYGGINILDINIPFVKQVHINQNYNHEILLELKNFENEKDLNRNHKYVPILNEDGIPCLMEIILFYKYEVDNKLIYNKIKILEEIRNKIDTTKNLTEEVLQQKYITDFLNSKYSESDFTKELKKVRQTNSTILKNFHHQKLQSYFFHQLFHNYQKDILLISGSHQFVITDTKKQENEELGRRTEWVVNRFLKNFIEFDKWFYIINDDKNDEDDYYGKTDYHDYPDDTIPVCETIWNNQSGESYKPYDFSINFRNVENKIEVKSTRGDEENVFYISVKELEELLKNPNHYFILRLSYIQQSEMYYGIQFNDEFYGRFYKIKPETIGLVKKKLPEWKEYYQSKTIRFTVDQFELIPDSFDENLEPILYPEPSILNSRYWNKYEKFVQKEYFNDLERIIDSYSNFPEISKLKEDLVKLKMDDKFHFVENLSNEEFVIPEEVEDITVVKKIVNPQNRSSNTPIEDDLPF